MSRENGGDLFVMPVSYDTPTNKHVKTYTAGEDNSRLKQAAKELGLERARKPRRQVRKRTRQAKGFGSVLQQVLLEAATTEDARVRSVYMSHTDFDHDFFISADWMAEELGALPEEEEAEISDLEAHGAAGGTLTAAVLGIIKGMVGPAILFLPHAFANAGYLIAIPILCTSTFMFLYSSTCLLDAWRVQKSLDRKKLAMTRDTEMTSLINGTKKSPLPLSYPELAYRALGSHGEMIVKSGIALMQAGVCLTYLIFVPQNLRTSVQIMTGMDISPNVWLILMVAIQVPLSWLRDIRRLTPTNLLANVLILYGLSICLGYAFREASTPNTPDSNLNTWDVVIQHFQSLRPFADGWYLFIGTSVLLFEGSITLLVPLQEAVHSEEQRAQFPSIQRGVVMSVIGFYLFFGIINWMAFGSNVRTVLTTSLPVGVLATTVQLAYSVAVIFTFPLQNFPALEIVCRAFSSRSFFARRNVISSCLVCVLAVVAFATMDSLDKVVSLMGSLLGCPIAFVFPPLIHSRLDPNISTHRLWGNRILASVGVAAMVYSAYTTISAWK